VQVDVVEDVAKKCSDGLVKMQSVFGRSSLREARQVYTLYTEDKGLRMYLESTRDTLIRTWQQYYHG